MTGVPLRVLSYNVHGLRDDRAALARLVRDLAPDVVIVVRADCAFGIPRMYAVCERLGLTYTFGLAANVVLQRQVEALHNQAITAYAHECQTAE